MENLESTLKCNEDDDDLNDLLDSALEEFEQVPRMMNKKTTMSTDTGTSRLKKNISGSEVQAELEKLNGLSVEEREKVIEKQLCDTLNQMSTSSENMKKNLPTEEELNALFQNLATNCQTEESSVSGSGSDMENLLPMMEGMMQSLMSKEMLYPPMRDIADKFPAWLADNRMKVGEEEFTKYNKQFDLTLKICGVFEQETGGDQAEERRRFDQVMRLMQEMQSLGHPPQELVGDSQASPMSLPGSDQSPVQ